MTYVSRPAVASAAGSRAGVGAEARDTGLPFMGAARQPRPAPLVTWLAGIDDGPCAVRGSCPSGDGACIASQAVRFPTARTSDATAAPGHPCPATPNLHVIARWPSRDDPESDEHSSLDEVPLDESRSSALAQVGLEGPSAGP